jgi:hypothetical protein
MDINGFSTDNTHDGTVFVFGDMNIEGNLTVGGTYPGGGGGGSVNNPMTSDLICDNYALLEVSELTVGEEGYIKMGSLDLQDNRIENVNTLIMSNGLTFNSEEPLGTNGQALLVNNGVVYYSDVLANPLTADLSANGFNIVNIESVSATYVDTDNINQIIVKQVRNKKNPVDVFLIS